MRVKHGEIPDRQWQKRLHEIIFEADTPAGKAFDVVLICAIVLSVVVVILDSVGSYQAKFGGFLYAAEWFFTILFTIEYVFRLLSVRRPLRYAGSFFGWIDILSILPTYLSLLFPGVQYLLTVRILRLLRIFRVFKLTEYVSEAHILTTALRASARKIGVFLFAVLSLVTVIGSLIYVIEGEQNGFKDIPTSIYWAIVTLTTVGYGDLAPKTGLGQFFASIVMILGYGIIAVPTGIVTVELSKSARSTQHCPSCSAEGHDADALFCKYCSERL
ncbi:MAG: ion transporter [Pyrinomonadaceae bacterium]|nr:ion transporter [Pyrinomonadaceae bacterium]